MQRLVCTRQLVQHRLQDPLLLGRGDELALVVNDADHEPAALALLRLDDSLQGVAEFDEREAGRDDADQLTAGSVHRFSDDDARGEGCFSRNAHFEDRSSSLAGPLDDTWR